ncbi:GTP cyclohydrolase II [Campylobacter avium LMG 24591]|uniref:GTP cyclohydrolase II n=1 Tax=Campylobacter avium LMG 24591 TaxID=522484 RepID=A0A222MVZ0_9BACT|nr:GTP cyclohydrolase II [Campylobacter avium]ASQ30113.1 GTP cyclohydrolase II [Campylobacter avium LMG 24591]OYD79212.1 GTP cyclohydrolase II [Campylobacter avium]
MDIKVSELANLPTKLGMFKVQSFKEGEKEHLCIMSKDLGDVVNVRIHSECLTGDALLSLKCDCGAQLEYALKYIQEHGGLVIYLRQEGRGIGLLNKINAYALQDKGLDTIEANLKLGFKADERKYDVVDFILDYYKIKAINLITNNPLKINSLKVEVKKRIPIKISSNEFNQDYLKIKEEKMGHLS